MEKDPLNLLYNYSKKYLSLQQKFTRFSLTFGSGILLAILIFFLIDLSNSYPDKVAFYIAIFLSILVSTILSLIIENREIKKLRAKQTYLVHLGHKTATHRSLENYLEETAGSNFHPAYDGLELNL